jgi:hypothetical protein
LRNPVLTLWPIANDVEKAAVQQALFGPGGLTFSTASSEYRFDFEPALAARGEVVDAWMTAAVTVEALSSGRVKVQRASPYGADGFVVDVADAIPACSGSWRLPVAGAGYCFERTQDYFVAKILVAPTALTAPPVALRALLNAWGLQAHSMPGLLNSTAPADGLSEFERKSVHMASLRGRVAWPDTEQ